MPADLVAVLDRRGITTPFPIQAATLPDALAGHDIAGRAPDGFRQDAGLRPPARRSTFRPRARRRPGGLVLVPTRELAEQVRRELAPLAAATGRRVTAIYGGVGYGPQRTALDRGVDIVVACPGRLEDLVAQRAIDLSRRARSPSSTKPTAWPTWASCPRSSGCSTSPRPTARPCCSRPRSTVRSTCWCGGTSATRAATRCVADDGEPGEVRHLFWRTDTDGRVALTADRGRPPRLGHRVLPDQARRRPAGQAARSALACPPSPSTATAPSRSGSGRCTGSPSGSARALVATDVAARGIHVDAVGCVVHFDPPADHKDYVHRSGRTGRAGVDGTVVSLS